MIEDYILPDKEKLKLNDITFEANLSTDNENKLIDNIELYPVVYYQGYSISLSSIKHFTIDLNGFSPTFSMVFNDTTGIMMDRGFPVDDSDITIRIPSRSKLFKSVFLQFKIVTFSIIGEKANSKIMSITGELDVNNLYLNEFKSYKNMSSWKCIYDVCKNAGLGFSSNISDTKDYMTWINPGLDVYDFVQTVLSNSWNGESSFLWTFIDQYYQLNFIDVEKALEEDISKDLMSLTQENILNPNKDETLVKLVLSNDPALQSETNYFESFKILNQSTKISLSNGYSKLAYYFDRRGAWTNRAGAFLSFEVDSINTPGSENNSIILKGKPKDYDFYKNNVNLKYIGKIDSSNVHKEYAYSDVQNEQNLQDLQKISIEIVLPNANFAVKKFKKVKIFFSNLYKRTVSDEFNAKMSGQWLITGIKYKLNNKKKLIQVLTLVKRELNIDDLQF